MPLLVNTLPAVLGAGGVTVNVPDDVIGPPVSVKPYSPAPVMLVTAAPGVTDVATVAVAAFPEILIGQVPYALAPSAVTEAPS